MRFTFFPRAPFAEAFMPEAALLAHQRSSRATILLFVATFGIVIAAFIAASLLRVDRLVIANGTLDTTVAPTSIRPLQTTTVKQILVVPGQQVRKGQILVRFDRSLDEDAITSYIEKARSLDSEAARLRSEISAGPTGIPRSAGPPNVQATLLGDRLDVRRAKADEFASQIMVQRATERSSAVAFEVDRATIRLETVKYAVLHRLFEQGYYPKLQLVQAQEALLQARSTFARDASVASQARDQARQLIDSAREFASQQHADTVSQYVQTVRDEQDAIAEIKKEQHLLSLSDVRAPFDASVIDVAPQDGTAIAGTQPLITLIPIATPLQANVFVENKDASYLRTGMEARVKVDAYPYERYGWITGHVTAIVRNALSTATPQGSAQSTDDKPTRYRAIVTLDPPHLRGLSKPSFLPGMTVEGDLRVGTQNVFSYLIDPIVHHFGNAFSEPSV